ncbi:MAG: 50S ribosomal protein L22 [Nanoarchaeota archaeon]
MAQKYAFENFNKETMARSCGFNLQISLKKSVEVAKAIKGKKVSTAIDFLSKVTEQDAVVPYTRFNQEMPHKRGKGIAAGGYPISVAKEFLRLVKSAEKNAKEQEISGVLRIISASTRKGANRYHMGRNMGRRMKSTNVEIIVGVAKK